MSSFFSETHQFSSQNRTGNKNVSDIWWSFSGALLNGRFTCPGEGFEEKTVVSKRSLHFLSLAEFEWGFLATQNWEGWKTALHVSIGKSWGKVNQRKTHILIQFLYFNGKFSDLWQKFCIAVAKTAFEVSRLTIEKKESFEKEGISSWLRKFEQNYFQHMEKLGRQSSKICILCVQRKILRRISPSGLSKVLFGVQETAVRKNGCFQENSKLFITCGSWAKNIRSFFETNLGGLQNCIQCLNKKFHSLQNS